MAQKRLSEPMNAAARPGATRTWRDALLNSPVPIKGKRRGFLPFDTNPWGRIFVSILLTIAIHLLWMRFLENTISLTVCTILTLIMTVIIFMRG